MTAKPAKRVPLWIWLPAGLLVLLAVPFAVSWLVTFDWKSLGLPASERIGPLRIHAWLPPKGFVAPEVLPLYDSPGMGLVLTDAPGGILAKVKPAYSLLVVRDQNGKLQPGVKTPYVPGAWQLIGDNYIRPETASLVAADGGIVQERNDYKRFIDLHHQITQCQLVFFAPEVEGGISKERAKLNFPDRLNFPLEATFLPLSASQALQISSESAATGQSYQLSSSSTSPGGEVLAEYSDVVKTGYTWVDGTLSLVMLTHPGKVFILDRNQQRFEPRPEFDQLAQQALAQPGTITALALADGCLATLSTAPATLRLFSAGAAPYAFEIRDALAPPGDTSGNGWNPDNINRGYREDAFTKQGVSLQREALRLPVHVVSGRIKLAPIDPLRIVISDYDYGRLIIVESTPSHQ